MVSELRCRNVLRMVVLYVVAAWLIVQVAEAVSSLVQKYEELIPSEYRLSK